LGTVALVDDNPGVLTALEVLLGLNGHRVLTARSPDEALALLKVEQIDVLIQDMNFSRDTTSGVEGIELFSRIRALEPDLPVVLLTAWTQLSAAVELIKAGAADYLAKPWDDHKLLATVNNLVELAELQRDNQSIRRAQRQRQSALAREHDLCGTIYASVEMERLLALAVKVAPTALSVLITGPNGAGKERIAEIIQRNSSVAKGPFISLNAGALPAELIEAELFGAEAGAYTGANRARDGRFEQADGGTLFLDEIGTLPANGQIKLLRVLETGEFARLGSGKLKRVNVRVIAATNADLRAEIKAGRFREDLYYRLNAIELKVPPLADRRDDILLLARHFLALDAVLSPGAERALLSYQWPGNVRELRNVIQRAKLMARNGSIEASDLDLPLPTASTPERALTRNELEQALKASNGNVSHAAASLGLSRQAFYRRLQK
jgi:DNA-binding NtrC family response regulator